jgi:hypothetical protein
MYRLSKDVTPVQLVEHFKIPVKLVAWRDMPTYAESWGSPPTSEAAWTGRCLYYCVEALDGDALFHEAMHVLVGKCSKNDEDALMALQYVLMQWLERDSRDSCRVAFSEYGLTADSDVGDEPHFLETKIWAGMVKAAQRQGLLTKKRTPYWKNLHAWRERW